MDATPALGRIAKGLIWRRRIMAAVLVVAYGVSLIAPAAHGARGPADVLPGYMVLLIGFLGPLQGQFAWWANPPLVGSILALAAGVRVPNWVSLTAVALACDSLLWRRMQTDNGPSTDLLTPGWGMWVWLGAIAALALFVEGDRPPRLESGAAPADHG